MSVTDRRPPRVAYALLKSLLRPSDSESIPGDLLEEYREVRCPSLGPLRADVWYMKQVLSVLWRVAWPCVVAIIALRIVSFPLPRGWNPSLCARARSVVAGCSRLPVGRILRFTADGPIHHGRRDGQCHEPSRLHDVLHLRRRYLTEPSPVSVREAVHFRDRGHPSGAGAGFRRSCRNRRCRRRSVVASQLLEGSRLLTARCLAQQDCLQLQPTSATAAGLH